MARTCSTVFPLVTVSDCAPDVLPVSPSTSMLTPSCVAEEAKCTFSPPAALSAAWYRDCALGVDAAPAGGAAATAAMVTAAVSSERMATAAVAAGGRLKRGGRMGVRCMGSASRHAWTDHDRRETNLIFAPEGLRRGSGGHRGHVVLMCPMETVACGASGRTLSPQLE